MSLYNNKNPKTTIHKFGYGNKQRALDTIKNVKSYNKNYQFQIINTMYNRAKYHKNRTKDMEEAMKIFNKWLQNYKKIKPSSKDLYPFLSLKTIKKYEPLADKYNISLVCRGLKKSKLTDSGFLEIYKKVKGNKQKLKDIPVKKSNPTGIDYYRKRDIQLKAKITQMKKMKIPLFDENNNPTKMHLILIMWAYSPKPNKL